MQNWKVAGCIAALVAAGVIGAAVPGSAQKNKDKVEAIVGFVDLATVTEQIKQTPAWNVLLKKATDEQAKAKESFDQLVKTRYLTPVERKQLVDLRAKPKLSDAEKDLVQKLEKQSDELDAEYSRIAQVEKPTTEQGKRLGELQKIRQDAYDALQDEKNKLQQSLDKLQAEMLDEMQGKVLKIVEDVAQSKGIVMVIDRQAILYGGQDLTSDVIKKLPK